MRKEKNVGKTRNLDSLKGNKPSFFPWGWSSTVAFAVFCFAFYSYSVEQKEQSCLELQCKIHDLRVLKQSSLEEREDLVLQIASQNDKDWIEMILKKRLGVVPEGQMKVYFKKEE